MKEHEQYIPPQPPVESRPTSERTFHPLDTAAIHEAAQAALLGCFGSTTIDPETGDRLVVKARF